MGESFADLRKASREPAQKPAGRAIGGSIPSEAPNWIGGGLHGNWNNQAGNPSWLGQVGRQIAPAQAASLRRKSGGAVPEDETFASGKAAVSNARKLEVKGDISKRELAGVERSVARGTKDRPAITGKPAERKMSAMQKADVNQKAAKPARSTKR